MSQILACTLVLFPSCQTLSNEVIVGDYVNDIFGFAKPATL